MFSWRIALMLGTGLAMASEAQTYIITPRLTGAQVTAVAANSPARRAGLQVGDVIVAIDGQPVRAMANLPSLLAGKNRTVLLVRDGRTGRYMTTVAVPFNGRLGILFLITAVPERSLPQMAGLPQRGQ